MEKIKLSSSDISQLLDLYERMVSYQDGLVEYAKSSCNRQGDNLSFLRGVLMLLPQKNQQMWKEHLAMLPNIEANIASIVNEIAVEVLAIGIKVKNPMLKLFIAKLSERKALGFEKDCRVNNSFHRNLSSLQECLQAICDILNIQIPEVSQDFELSIEIDTKKLQAAIITFQKNQEPILIKLFKDIGK